MNKRKKNEKEIFWGQNNGIFWNRKKNQVTKTEKRKWILFCLIHLFDQRVNPTPGVGLDMTQEDRLFPTAVSKKHIYLIGTFSLETTVEY